jgi:hypothetical protein
MTSERISAAPSKKDRGRPVDRRLALRHLIDNSHTDQGDTAMEYMILIHADETAARPQHAPGSPEFVEMMSEWMAFNQRLIDGGHWVAGAMLQPTTAATTIAKTQGAAPTVTDGPYAETKEQLGGFYMIRADDLDQAMELARAIPMPTASLEVRPVAFRPDAG